MSCSNAHLLSLESSNKDKIIAIQTFGEFDTNLLDRLKSQLSKIFNAEVVIYQSIALPNSLADKYDGKVPADSLLTLLEKEKKGRVVEVIGLTNKEIFIPKLHEGFTIPEIHSIRGYGYVSKGICIVSNYSLTSLDRRLHENRLFKATLHEVGHNIGLAHCSSSGCIMTEKSGDIVVLDTISGSFCEKCKRQAS